MLLQQRERVGLSRGESVPVLALWLCNLPSCPLCLSFWPVPMRKKTKEGMGTTIRCYYCDLLDLQSFVKLCKISPGKMLLNKAFAWPFYFTSRFVVWFQNSAASKEKNSLKFVISLENREKKKSEKEGKMCFSDIHTAWSTVLHSPAPRLPSILHGQRVLGNEFLFF